MSYLKHFLGMYETMNMEALDLKKHTHARTYIKLSTSLIKRKKVWPRS